MKTSTMTRNKSQVYSVGNYLMTGKVLGKGHFARVEEATHRIVGKKVAIKVIDLTCIKEEYARRNLHREPKVMAKLNHPCIAALYETMMHGPRLYVVMEAAGGGDLCAHVVGARAGAGGAAGLGEPRARALSAQLVSAVKHMHSRGVVHRDLKMENIMLDSSKQFIKIVDFGLSNVWVCGGGLRTPCGSLEYAAPELFVDGRKYGPEVDLWSIGVIVYGMVTGSLPFGSEGGGGAGTRAGGAGAGAGGAGCAGGAGAGEEPRSRPRLRAAITRGFARKQRLALHAFTPDCRAFIQELLEPHVERRMKIEEASRHRWLRKPGMRMKTNPFTDLDHKTNREIYRQISEVLGMSVSEVSAAVRAAPWGSVGGLYNVKAHAAQLAALPPAPLWAPLAAPAPAPTPAPHTPPATAPAITHHKIQHKMSESGDCGTRLSSIAERPATHTTHMHSWRNSTISGTPPARLLLQTNATTIKRASLGNITSPHSSTNSNCKSERALPIGWYSRKPASKEITPLQRFRRITPIK